MMRIGMSALVAVVFLAACDSGGPEPAAPDAGGAAAATDTGGSPNPAGGNGGAKEPDRRMVGAVDSRQAVLTVLKDNFVPLALMANGRMDYDPARAQVLADRLPVMIGMLEERFAIDTRGSGVETEALDAIWEDMDAFKGKISDAMTAARNLQTVASDEARFEDAAMEMRNACGSCHDDFRVDDD